MEPVFADRKSVLDYAERTFGTLPDYPWLKDPKSAVLRHQDTAKWYGLIMKSHRNGWGFPVKAPWTS